MRQIAIDLAMGAVSVDEEKPATLDRPMQCC